jgi:hypothetical protein
MKWLARLKKIDTSLTAGATETTKRVSVVFAAPGMASLQKTAGTVPAANDPAKVSTCINNAVDSEPGTMVRSEVRREVRTEIPVASGMVSTKVSTETAGMPDPDRWCWPHSTAMNTAEIDTFTARLARFTDKGLGLDDAEKLADQLMQRDRETDDRRLCLECQHCAGYTVGAMRCGNWQWAGIALRASDAQLSAELVIQLQRCDGFTAAQGAEHGED